MMSFCEYHKCERAAEKAKCGILRKWSSYHFRDNPNHTQEIALCKKHLAKISKLLGLKGSK